MTGRIVKKETSFEIAKHGIVRIAVKIMNRKIIDLTLYNILYIPDLLISIYKICRLGLAVTFGENKVITSFDNNKMAIYSIKCGIYTMLEQLMNSRYLWCKGQIPSITDTVCLDI